MHIHPNCVSAATNAGGTFISFSSAGNHSGEDGFGFVKRVLKSRLHQQHSLNGCSSSEVPTSGFHALENKIRPPKIRWIWGSKKRLFTPINFTSLQEEMTLKCTQLLYIQHDGTAERRSPLVTWSQRL